jgi:hypothetical protein
MLPEKSIRLVIAPSPTSIEGEKASLAFRGLFLCVVHYLIDDALAVRANYQAKTPYSCLNLARWAIPNSGNRWPAMYAFTFRFA